MTVQYDQLHMMTNNPTKYENFRAKDLRGDMFIKFSCAKKKSKVNS